MPLLGVKHVHDTLAVQFHACEDLGPKHKALDVPSQRRWNGPQAYGAIDGGIDAAGHQGFAVWTESDETDGGLMAPGSADELASGGIPDARRLVAATGGDEAIVRAERDRLHSRGMGDGRQPQFAGGHVPQPGGTILAAGEEGLAVMAENRGLDRSVMHQRFPAKFAGRRIPEPHSVVVPGGAGVAAVRTEGDGADDFGGMLQGVTDGLASCRIPQTRPLSIQTHLSARGQQHFPVRTESDSADDPLAVHRFANGFLGT
jgi:hypothetical protein